MHDQTLLVSDHDAFARAIEHRLRLAQALLVLLFQPGSGSGGHAAEEPGAGEKNQHGAENQPCIGIYQLPLVETSLILDQMPKRGIADLKPQSRHQRVEQGRPQRIARRK